GIAGTATVATAAPSGTPSVTPAAPSGVAPRPAPPPPPPAAVVPPAAPPQVALAPLPPAAPAAAPPPPPVVAQAPSQATANTPGQTVSVGPDSADLSPASAAAVASLAHSVPQSDSISFNVLAYAHGQADDPSSARRLSLSRALSIRSALTAAGVSSTRIYLRALGAEAGGGSPDRADITVMGANAPATTAAATPNAAPRGKQE
ncbi:MAG TPA: OmpA family protein, partial [Acetobacteraceae bacterium]